MGASVVVVVVVVDVSGVVVMLPDSMVAFHGSPVELNGENGSSVELNGENLDENAPSVSLRSRFTLRDSSPFIKFASESESHSTRTPPR